MSSLSFGIRSQPLCSSNIWIPPSTAQWSFDTSYYSKLRQSPKTICSDETREKIFLKWCETLVEQKMSLFKQLPLDLMLMFQNTLQLRKRIQMSRFSFLVEFQARIRQLGLGLTQIWLVKETQAWIIQKEGDKPITSFEVKVHLTLHFSFFNLISFVF